MQNRIIFILFFGFFFLKANIVSSQQKDIYNFSPEIEKEGELIHRFFYLDKEGKYFTKK